MFGIGDYVVVGDDVAIRAYNHTAAGRRYLSAAAEGVKIPEPEGTAILNGADGFNENHRRSAQLRRFHETCRHLFEVHLADIAVAGVPKFENTAGVAVVFVEHPSTRHAGKCRNYYTEKGFLEHRVHDLQLIQIVCLSETAFLEPPVLLSLSVAQLSVKPEGTQRE